MLLPNGITLHSRFKLPLKIDGNSTIGVRVGSKAAGEINAASVMFLDEVSMCSSKALSTINLGLKDLRNSTLPFGGMFLIMGGDFRQILPVIRHGTRGDMVSQCLKSFPLWNQFRVLSLSQNMRANADQVAFANWLLDVGNGVDVDSDHNISISNQCIVRSNLVTEIFGATVSQTEMHQLPSKVILCSTNDKVHELNKQIVQRLPGELVIIKSIDKILCEPGEDPTEYPTEFLNTILSSGLPPHELHLKVGAIVMPLRNMDLKNRLCNGVRLRIVHVLTNLLDCEIVTGSFAGKHVLLSKINLEPSDDLFPFKFQRKQFPVRLSFAMNINKSQGQTFEKVGIHLDKPVFAHGQLYVALSRAKSISSLKIKLPGTNTITKNIVYQEVLQ